MRSVLVTGASGFCGKAVVERLRAQGVAVVTVATRGERPRPELFREVIAAERPDTVFHLAGVMHGASLPTHVEVNCGLAAALFDALDAEKSEARVILAGTAAEYGMVAADRLPVTEDEPCKPVGGYGISKLLQTQLAASQRRPTLVVRPANVLGAHMPPYFALMSFALQIAAIERGERPPVIDVGNLESGRDFVDVNDAAALYVRLGATDATGIVNLASGVAVTIKSALDRLVEHASVACAVRIDPARYKAGDVNVFRGSPARLESLVGPLRWTPLDQTLDAILASARESTP